jgi:sulfonate transport system permease protein
MKDFITSSVSGLKARARGLLVPILLLIVWKLAADREWFPPQLLVPPETVFDAFRELIKDGSLQENLLVSLGRVAKGFLLGASLGFGTGIVLGLSRYAEELIAPTLHAVRQVPLLGWMPLIILWFGIGEASKIVFIAIGAFFPTLLNTFVGIRGVSREFLEVGKVYQLNWVRQVLLVIIPAALPSIVSGVRLSISISWLMVVGAELITANSGIGQMMTTGREMFRTDIVMVGIIVIGVIGLVIDNTVRRIESGLVRWKSEAKS